MACRIPDHFAKPPPPAEVAPMVSAWFLMGNRIDWQALPTVFELLGWKDYEAGIACLAHIQEVANSEG